MTEQSRYDGTPRVRGTTTYRAVTADGRPNPSATEDPDAFYRPDHPLGIADTCRR